MQQVLDYLAKNEARFIDELCEYIHFPSVSAQSGNEDNLRACVEWLANHCRQIGLNVHICQTAGNPVVIAQTSKTKSTGKPHFLVYGHYDVQPAEPMELWKTPPFEPYIKGRLLFGRGASDNKGQHFAHLKAIEAYIKTGTELPCDVTFVIEGEEEVGSTNFSSFLRDYKSELCCEAVVISDNDLPDLKHPALTYGLRGVVAFEVMLSGPERDLHSGIFGGSVDNPAMVLCQVLGQLRDKNGHITIPSFYDTVVPLTDFERKQMARIPFDAAAYREFLGVPKLFGEHSFTPDEQRRARPTFEINSLISSKPANQ